MAGADPARSDHRRRAGAGTTWPRPAARSRASRSACPPRFYVDDLDPEVGAGARRDHRDVQASTAPKIVKVELPDQRQLTAACQIVLAAEAAAFHKRVDDRAAAGLRRAGADAAAERACDYSAVDYLEAMRWRGPALAAYLAAIGDAMP